jgi:hypothetical protein
MPASPSFRALGGMEGSLQACDAHLQGLLVVTMRRPSAARSAPIAAPGWLEAAAPASAGRPTYSR